MPGFLDFLADEANPPDRFSRWYCDRPDCDGEPHGPHWVFCEHPAGGHKPRCRHARAAQRPPEGDWFVWLMLTGRGFGKSRSAAEWLIDRALHEPTAEWGVIARNAADVRKNARDMDAGLVRVAGGTVQEGGHVLQYNRHEEDIYLDNGAVLHLISAEKPDRLRGFNLAGAWADELASWKYAEETWDYGLVPTLRVGSHPRVVVTTTPKPVPLIKRLVKEAQDESGRPVRERSKVITIGSTWDNARNLAASTIEELKRYDGTRVGRQELEGELIFDLSGTLVSLEDIERGRVAPASFPTIEGADDTERVLAHMERVVVGVDPAGSYGEEADETGIVVCAKGRDGHGYVLEDRSGKHKPKTWATIAVAAMQRWQAGVLVAEVNVGNNLVEEVVRTVAPYVHFKPVRALQGKILRAEPVTALYEQGRIHHLGTFPKLENQLITFTPEMAMKNTRGTSPDRMDAMVHAFTELGLARWGPTAAFRQMMDRAAEANAAKSAGPDDRTRKAAERFIASRARRRPAPIRCTHRWHPTSGSCVFCGARREAG